MEYETDISEPHVSSFAGAHSIDQLWVGAGGPYDEKYTFEIGWDVDPGMWGSSPAPHFFIFVNPDEYGSESAYDPTSFVPVGEPRIVPGETLTPETSAYRFGVEYRGGNWWIWAANQWIGYVRGSAWGNHFTKAESEADYGEVFDSGENPTTQMGDGQPGASAGATWMSQAVVIRKEGVEETTGYHGSASDPSLYSLGDCNTGKCEPATTLWHFGGSGIPDPPPSVVTEAATGIQESQATLHGSVNPNGLDTHYHFQYGTTTAYGSTTPEVDAGKGTSPVAESASISNLEPGATYHFRILASNADGTSYGNDLSFRVLTPPSMTIANGKIVAFTGDTSSALYATTSDFVQNTWQSTSVEPASTAYSAASAVTGPGGEIWSAFEGPGNTLWVGLDRASGGWGVSYESPANGTTYSAPSTVVDTNKNLWVAAEGPNHTLNLAEYTGSGEKRWTVTTPITAADVYSAPSAVAGPGGEVWIAFEGPNNQLWTFLRQSNGEAGVVYEGASNTTYSSPSTVIDSNKNLWVAAEGPSHTLNLAEYPGSGEKRWTTSTPIGAGGVYSPPSAAAGPSGELWIAFEGPNNSQWVALRQSNGEAGAVYESAGNTTYSAPSTLIDAEGNIWVGAEGGGGAFDVTVRLKSTGAWQASWQGVPDAASVTSAPSLVAANGGIAATTQGIGSALYMTTSDFVQNTWQSTSVEPASTAYSAASAVTGPGGEIWSAFEGPGNTLWVGLDRASGGWGVSYESPANGTTYSAPSTVVDTNKNLWVAAEGPNHTLNLAEYTYASPKKWVLSTPVTAADVYSAPSAVAGPGGEVWIAFEGPSNSLWVVLQRPNGEAGVVYEGASNTTYSAPSTTIASGKYVWVAAEGPNHTLDLAEYSLSNGWVTSTPVSGADVYSAPSMAAGPGGELWIAFQGPGSTLWDGVRFTSGTWSTSYESPTEGTTYSAPSEVIDSEGNVWVAAQGAGDTLDVTVRLKSTGAWTGSYQGG